MSLILIMNFCKGQVSGERSSVARMFPEYYGLKNIQDTLIPTPDTTLRKLLIAAEERNNLKKQVRNLEEQIKLMDAVIKEQVSKGELQNEFHQNQLDNLRDQLAKVKEIADEFEMEVKREKRRKRWTAVGGIVTTTAALLLTLKK